MARSRTVVAGTGLGVLLLSALTLTGSMMSGDSDPPAPALPQAPEPGTLSAAQPELEQAVLRPADVPGSYVTAPKATVRRLPTPERCSTLLDPNALVRSARVAETTGEATTRLQGPAQLTQLLTTFSGDGAAATLQELRRITEQCRTFRGALDDGTPVHVRVEEAAVPASADTYTIKMTLTGDGRTMSGYLTLRRAGQVLSVLRSLGSSDAVNAIDPLKLVDVTLERLTQQQR